MAILVSILLSLYIILVTAWVSGALYFDLGKEKLSGKIAIIIWLIFVGTIIFLYQLGMGSLILTGALLVILLWWFSQQPSNDREWDPNFSQLCRIHVHGDQVDVENVRNTEYRSLNDYDLQYENRSYRLSDLVGADILILFWGSDMASHPMLIFDFGEHRHLCFSVETRYRKDQDYNVLKGLYRQYELMYVVSDERDAILRRSKYGDNQDCFLYRIESDLESVRQLFLDCVQSTNALADTPRWYHIITDNCTSAVIKRRSRKVEFDPRYYVNGALDKLLYERCLLVQDLPFDELKDRKSVV